MDTCTLALQFNYTKKLDSQGTVWIFNGDGRSDLAQPEPLDEMPGWTRVAGPLPFEMAGSIHGALKDFFTRSGVTVIDEGIAD